MADRDAELNSIASRQHRIVTTKRLRSLRLSRSWTTRHVADGDLTRLHHRVYLVGPGPPTRKGRWLAAVLGAGSGALLAKTDASALWDIAKTRGSRIDVLVPASRHPKLKGVRIHRCRSIHPDDRSMVDSIPVTSVERTLCDLAVVVPYADLKRAYEKAEGRHLVDHRKLREEVGRMSGTSGAWHSDPEAFERDHAKLAQLRIAGCEVLAVTHRQVTRECEWVANAIQSILIKARGRNRAAKRHD